VTPHILRHTFGSVATGLGYSKLIIKGLLGHASRGSTEIYTHVPDPALLSAAEATCAAIAAALDAGAEIVELPAAA
jgi:site-specific recombinase XerD